MLPLPLPLIRVLDLTTSAAGAYASRWLADCGAEVIVLERPDRERTVMEQLGRNKFSCFIRPSAPEGRALLLRLAAACHVVLKDEGDDALRELDYAALRAVRDDSVVAVIATYGDSADIGDAAAAAVMTALFNVRFRGQGQEVTIAAAAVTTSLRTAPIVAAAAGASRLTPDLPGSGCYACSEGSIALVVRSIEELTALCQVVGSRLRPDAEVADDELRTAVVDWAAVRTAGAAAAELNHLGIAAQEVLSPTALRDDPHLRARGVFETVAAGEAVREMDGPRLRFSDTPLHTRFATPSLGAQTGYVLRRLIGLSDGEIASLATMGVVRGET